MWGVIPFLKLFADPLFAGRFLSVICGMATLGGVYLIAKLLFKSQKVALVAAAITATSPFMVFFDRMALADSLLTTTAVWTFYLAVITARTLRLDMAMLTGFTLGAGLLTKSPALFFAILLPSAGILIDWQTKKRIKILVQFVFLLAVSLAIGFGLYNILRLGPNFHLLASRNMDYVYPYTHIFANFFDPFIPHLKDTLGYFWLLGPGSLVLLFSVGLVSAFKSNWKVGLVLSLWFFFPLAAVTLYAKVYTARYILYLVPFAALLAAAAFLNRAKLTGIITLIFLAFIFQSLYLNRQLLVEPEKAALPRSERSGYLEEWTAGYGIKEVADLIKEEFKKEPDRKIVVGTEGYFGTLPDGLQIYLNERPEITVVGVGLGIDKVPQPLVESQAAGNKTYLVINNTRLLKNSEKLGLTLIAAYPKAVRPNGSREALLFFEVGGGSINGRRTP
jgi:hypothetical protein